MTTGSFSPDNKAEETEMVFSSLYDWDKYFYGPLLEKRSQARTALPPLRFKSALVQEVGLEGSKRRFLAQQLDFIFQSFGWEGTQIKVEALDGKEYVLTSKTWKDLQPTVFPKVLHPSQKQQRKEGWKGTHSTVVATVQEARTHLTALKKAMRTAGETKRENNKPDLASKKKGAGPVTLEPLARRSATPGPAGNAPSAGSQAGSNLFAGKQNLKPLQRLQTMASPRGQRHLMGSRKGKRC